MREFKFRAYSKDNGCWCGAFCVHKSGMISDMIDAKIDKDSGIAISNAHWGENDLILMQYTGLKDKNGVEIYEGDIVKGNYLRKVGVIEWNKSFCKFDISHRMNISPSDEFEVIRNIYENKELLK